MGLRNKTTFDPYSVSEVSVRDALRSGRQSWRQNWLAFLGLAAFTSVPSVLGFVWASNVVMYTASGTTLIILTAIISPTVARQARGLKADFTDTFQMIGRRLFPLVITGLVLACVVAGPALLALPFGRLAANGGLLIGTLLAGPLVLAIPVVVIESVPVTQTLRRSASLVSGRWHRAIPLLAFAVLSASLPALVGGLVPEIGIVALCLQPFLLAWSAIAVGALYTNLYIR